MASPRAGSRCLCRPVKSGCHLLVSSQIIWEEDVVCEECVCGWGGGVVGGEDVGIALMEREVGIERGKEG